MHFYINVSLIGNAQGYKLVLVTWIEFRRIASLCYLKGAVSRSQKATCIILPGQELARLPSGIYRRLRCFNLLETIDRP